MEELEFTNLEGDNLKRRKITIVSQTGNEIIADIDFIEDVKGSATPITAQIMNDFKKDIALAKSKSGEALESSVEAKTDSADALANSNTALTKAESAESAVNEALTRIIEEGGSVVTKNGQKITPFETTDKLDVKQGAENANKIMVTNENGNIVPSSVLQIGDYKIYEEVDPETGVKSLVIENFKENNTNN